MRNKTANKEQSDLKVRTKMFALDNIPNSTYSVLCVPHSAFEMFRIPNSKGLELATRNY